MVKLEQELKDFILKNLEFKLDGKTIKRGKLRVFNTKQFFIKFKLETDVIKEYELPYPYQWSRTENGIVFDYCLSSFCPKTDELYWRMKMVNSTDSSKIHEKYLFIVALSS